MTASYPPKFIEQPYPDLLAKCVSCKTNTADVFLGMNTAVCLGCFKDAIGSCMGMEDQDKPTED